MWKYFFLNQQNQVVEMVGLKNKFYNNLNSQFDVYV